MTITNHTATSVDAIDLDRLEALARTATPGPWRAIAWTCHAPTTVRAGAEGVTVADTTGHGRHSDVCAVDAAFIAAAHPATVLALIAQARAAAPAATSTHIKTWQERLPAPRTVMRCTMNCSPSIPPCEDCLPEKVLGDAVAARDAEIAELRTVLAQRAGEAAAAQAANSDKALLDDLDAWVKENKEAGREWFSFAFDTKNSAREQIAAHAAKEGGQQ